MERVLEGTEKELVSAYSISDRGVPRDFRRERGGGEGGEGGGGHDRVTFIGDAAHPLTPFKGWGGNAALADGLSLARHLHLSSSFSLSGPEKVLERFEREMLDRVRGKVEKSREAVEKLHGPKVLTRENVTRGSL